MAYQMLFKQSTMYQGHNTPRIIMDSFSPYKNDVAGDNGGNQEELRLVQAEDDRSPP